MKEEKKEEKKKGSKRDVFRENVATDPILSPGLRGSNSSAFCSSLSFSFAVYASHRMRIRTTTVSRVGPLHIVVQEL